MKNRPIKRRCNCGIDTLEPLFRVPDAATRYGVTEHTIYQWIANGELDAIRLGAKKNAPIRIPASALVRFEGQAPSTASS